MLALRHWARVLRPGGFLLLMVPDPCERGLMDRVRLALPADHFVEEYRAGAKPVRDAHGDEVSLSAVRYSELALNHGKRMDTLSELRGAEAYLASTAGDARSGAPAASAAVRAKAEAMVKLATFLARSVPDYPPLNLSHVSAQHLNATRAAIDLGSAELGHAHARRPRPAGRRD